MVHRITIPDLYGQKPKTVVHMATAA